MTEPGSLADHDMAVRHEAERLLREEKFWSFHAFAWLNENDANPEYVGLAMWQTDAAGDPYLYYGLSSSKHPPPPDPEEWRQLVAVAGTDFDGMIEVARASIGLLLVQAKLRRDNQFHDENLFDLHRMSSMIHLGTASERLRELYIASVFHQSSDGYKTKNTGENKYRGPDKVHKRSEYATPFIEACHITKPHHAKLTNQFDGLPSMAETIQKFRQRRNEIIHEIATSMARSERDRLRDGSWKDRPPTDIAWEDFEQAIETSTEEHHSRIAIIISELRDWYMLLVRASNEVLYIEHHLRPQQPARPKPDGSPAG